ncbi:SDR family oxidoreductase [Geodermatophilus sp. YIM 151500]|uniref:SDR family NAD(P)-dependent oxidoreductase n=1 Tax=Geodermatophilus sp. YIM 151500 TaxID=2984531 RepID=UPI0021E37B2D|nr:SDR family oxidoreductase [Geodermatophilus sp. YIM 151500]MCV2491591.1 SDR family oxidoreductase [Geodermatophilus sp. YIM 151500]
MNRLSGRRVLVVGGARGVGAAMVRAFTADGATVAVLARHPDDVARIAVEVDGRAWTVDLQDPTDVRETMEKAIAHLGRIDVLVNNPGIARFASLLEVEPADVVEPFAMQTRSMLLTTQIAARAMIGFRTPSSDCPGKVINVAGASLAGDRAPAHYAACRAAVMALTTAAAHELGPHGITVNCLCPGVVPEELDAAERLPARLAALSAHSPLGRLAEPGDVARAAVFLASSDSDYLTGDALNVAGGMAMR